MTLWVGRVPPLGDEADKTGLRGAVDASRSVDGGRSVLDAAPMCRRLAPALCIAACFSDRATSQGTTHRCAVCARAFLSKSAAPAVPVVEP
jgi:hypothetical protein